MGEMRKGVKRVKGCEKRCETCERLHLHASRRLDVSTPLDVLIYPEGRCY